MCTLCELKLGDADEFQDGDLAAVPEPTLLCPICLLPRHDSCAVRVAHTDIADVGLGDTMHIEELNSVLPNVLRLGRQLCP